MEVDSTEKVASRRSLLPLGPTRSRASLMTQAVAEPLGALTKVTFGSADSDSLRTEASA